MDKKILIVANVAKEHILKFHIPTIKMLKENGWTVHVACSGQEMVPYCDRKWDMRYKRSPFSIKTLMGIFDLKKVIDAEGYDIIHCHTATGGLVARLASAGARKKGTKVLYTAHGYHFYKGASIVNWLLYFPIEWFLSFLTDCIITINEEDFKNTSRFHFGAKHIKKINGMGVDMDRFSSQPDAVVREEYRRRLGIDSGALVLIYIAEITANKNQGFLIKMMDKLRREIDSCCLLLVGPDHTKGEYCRMVENLDLNEHIRFLGWRDDIRELLCISDIAVASSIREGLPLNLIEAMASGVPVVAVRNRGHDEIISDGRSGFIIERGDIDEMVKRVLLLHNDQETKKRLVAAGKKEAERFDRTGILSSLSSLYKEFAGC